MNHASLDDGTLDYLRRFADVLRGAGLDIGLPRLEGFLAGVLTLDGVGRDQIYYAGRATLCGSIEDLRIFERCFEQFFDGVSDAASAPIAADTQHFRQIALTSDADTKARDGMEDAPDLAVASADEILRQRNFAAMTEAERDEIFALIAQLKMQPPMRRSRRLHRARSGAIAARQTVRASLATGGDVIELRYRKVRPRPRKYVLLVDVSGSMKPYADPLLRFALAAQLSGPRSTHVFSVGTRLTYLSPECLGELPAHAIEAAGKTIPDWHGGTRLGEQLQEFIERWGRRGMARGAIVVIASDGFEQGEAGLLGEQMSWLRRFAHRIVWCNPHKSAPGYAPLAGGMRAALPHIDDFVPGCNFVELVQLARTIAGPDSRPRRSSAPPG